MLTPPSAQPQPACLLSQRLLPAPLRSRCLRAALQWSHFCFAQLCLQPPLEVVVVEKPVCNL